MKFHQTLVALAAGANIAMPAVAQSSVTISGTLDSGFQYNTNSLSAGKLKAVTRHEPSFLRFSGIEDLGGGWQARFALDMGITVPTGATSGFSRESSVGIGHKDYGNITLGRQYDTMVEMVGVDPPRSNSVNAVHVGNWDRTAGNFLNNIIKVRTANLHGFTGTLLYSLKGDESSTAGGRSIGASGQYVSGPLRLSASFLRVNDLAHRPFNDVGQANLFGGRYATTAAAIVTDDTIAGLGAYYDVSGWRVLGNATRTKLEAKNGSSETYKNLSLGLVRSPSHIGLRPGVGVNVTKIADSRFTSVYGILDYYFSRRTDVYIRVVSQKASGPTDQRAALYLEGPSNGDRQTVVGVGLTHRF